MEPTPLIRELALKNSQVFEAAWRLLKGGDTLGQNYCQVSISITKLGQWMLPTVLLDWIWPQDQPILQPIWCSVQVQNQNSFSAFVGRDTSHKKHHLILLEQVKAGKSRRDCVNGFPNSRGWSCKNSIKIFYVIRELSFQMSLKHLVAKFQVERAISAFYVVLAAKDQTWCCISKCWVMFTQTLSLSQSRLQRICDWNNQIKWRWRRSFHKSSF